MDLFYGTRKIGRKQYSYDLYGDFEESQINEKEIIDDALSCIKNYKKKQEAGIPDITLNQFIIEANINILAQEEKKIDLYSQEPIWRLESKIKQLMSQKESNNNSETEDQLKLYSEALRRKQQSNKELEALRKNLEALQLKVDNLNQQTSEEQETVNQFYEEQERKESEKIRQIQESYNNIRFSQNLVNSKHLLYLIDEYIEINNVKLDKQRNLTSKKQLEEQIQQIKRSIQLNQIKIDFSINQMESYFNDEVFMGKLISSINHSIGDDFAYRRLASNHIDMFFTRPEAFASYINFYVVIERDNGLGQKLERIYPKLFTFWETSDFRYKTFINRSTIDTFKLLNDERLKFKTIQDSAYDEDHWKAKRQVKIVPSFDSIVDNKNHEGLEPRIIYVDSSGKYKDVFGHKDFKFFAIKDKIKIIDHYDIMLDIKIIFEILKFDSKAQIYF